MKQHIAILCSRLDMPGGIERAVVNTANLFSAHHHQVTLLILDESDTSFYPVHPAVNVQQYNLDFGITQKGNMLTRKIRMLQQIIQLKKILKQIKPNVIIGSEYQLTIAGYLAAKNLQVKVFAWEHHHFYWLKKSRFWQKLYQYVYQRVEAVVCLNTAEESLHKKAKHPTAVIPNFVERREKSDNNTKTILTVGRLILRKGVDRIPLIAEKIFSIFPNWRWIIIGDGPENELIRQALEDKNLLPYVSLISPFSYDLSSYYKTTSIYVMTSRFECFPMVLLEAMAHGIPCISFDCPTGPSFIIRNEINGALIKDGNISDMINVLLDYMSNEEKLINQAKNAYDTVYQWSPEVVYKKWERIFS